jgi:membrane protease YdiL (CAAX protease family)
MQEIQLIVLLGASTLSAWTWVVYRSCRRQQVLPSRPQFELASWGLLHVVFTIITIMLFQAATQAIMEQQFPPARGDSLQPGEQAIQILVVASAGLVGALLSLLSIVIVPRNRPPGSNLNTLPLPKAIGFGLLGFCCFATPAYIIQSLLTPFDDTIHPIIKALLESGDLTAFYYMALAVVLVVPFTEEIIFRLFIQGYLQTLFAARTVSDLFVTDNGTPAPLPRSTCWPSILISSTVFSLVHIPAGASTVVALFPFAIGLGLLFQRTGRLLPSVVMHMALNGFTMLAIYLKLVG